MSKDLIYSTQSSDYIRGRSYSNPRMFNGQCRVNFDRVIVLGDFPNVVRAYQMAGVPVIVGEPGQTLEEVEKLAPTPKSAEVIQKENRIPPPAEIEIPENWEELSWFELRSLARDLSADKIAPAKKTEAVEWIGKEVARRAGQ